MCMHPETTGSGQEEKETTTNKDNSNEIFNDVIGASSGFDSGDQNNNTTSVESVSDVTTVSSTSDTSGITSDDNVTELPNSTIQTDEPEILQQTTADDNDDIYHRDNNSSTR